MDAAYVEFSKWGLAGARVDRIAAVASANKQAIYAYFGSKENLFDAVLADRLGVLADTVPYTPEDLPGYAGALFDALNATPDLLRLTRWRGLERDDATPGEIESHVEKAVALRAALGLPDDRTAVDLLEIVVAIGTAWSSVPPGLRAVGGEEPEQRQAAHREMVVAAVAAICQSVTGKTTLARSAR